MPDHADRLARALLSLDGLSIGDAFGERYFGRPDLVLPAIRDRVLAPAPWRWTDDTAMAISIVDVLGAEGRVDPDRLAVAFGERYAADPRRGYGGTAHEILADLHFGRPWREVAAAVFDGTGSMGNGGAMRVAPVGAWFADDLDRVVEEARTSALPTHAHPDGQAGAIATAVAAAVAWQERGTANGLRILEAAHACTPEGPTRYGLVQALRLREEGASVEAAARVLGTGWKVISSDTVPFALFCASRHLDNFVEGMWTTVSGLGDRDTTCAIVGGILALAVGPEGIPAEWRAAREPLPGGVG